MKWDVPTGQRNYIDTVERVFQHKVPGRKSESYGVTIRNTGITDINMKAGIEEKIRSVLSEVAPVYTYLNRITWDEATLSAAAPKTRTMLYESPIQRYIFEGTGVPSPLFTGGGETVETKAYGQGY